MNIAALIDALPDSLQPQLIPGDSNIDVSQIADDSREVQPGALFVAVVGVDADGRDYLPQALEKGAAAAIVSSTPEDAANGYAELKKDPRLAQWLEQDKPVIAVTDSRLAAASAALTIHDRPDLELSLIGVTGTNGKSTTAALVRQLCEGCGMPAADIGTLGVWDREAKQYRDLGNTTPGPVLLAKTLRELADAGVQVVPMEVSSHAIHQQRVAGLRFHAAGFTNLSQDHLDYHGTMEAYAAVKGGWLQEVVAQEQAGAVVVNVDDPVGREYLEALQQAGATAITYGCKKFRSPDLLAERAKLTYTGMRAVWKFPGDVPRDLELPLLGQFNVYNALAALGLASTLDLSLGELLRELTWVAPPAGRFEQIKAGQPFTAIVDYAHTPDALENLLKQVTDLRAQRENKEEENRGEGRQQQEFKPLSAGAAAPSLYLNPKSREAPDTDVTDSVDSSDEETDNEATGKYRPKVIVVFGAGGDRDAAKRPLMAQAVAKHADTMILTSDNPRSENPRTILEQVQAGVPEDHPGQVEEIEDRAVAIQRAVEQAAVGDFVVVAGKGHETYQEINGDRYPFDDAEVLRDALKRWGENSGGAS
jgi:UDP-N-acetylmuramoyl-L-alanyl-D-glutamate--2,6-diaminopimelate ligase